MRNSFSAGTLLVSFICLFVVVGGMYFVNSRREAALLIPETPPAATKEPPFPSVASDSEPLSPDLQTAARFLADLAETIPPAVPSENPAEIPESSPEAAAGPEGAPIEPEPLPESSEESLLPGEAAIEAELEADGLPEASPEDAPSSVVSGVIAKGDSASELLSPYLSPTSVRQLLDATRKVHPLSNIRTGQPYTLVRTPDGGDMERFEYEIDDLKKLIVTRTDEGLVAHVEPIVYDFNLVCVGGTIRSSLFETLASTGESPILAVRISDIFGSEINFIKDLREGDSFSLLIEKRFRDETFKGYGRVLGATFTNQGKTYEAYLFDGGDGRDAFYNAKGESLKKTLLKAPLAFTRISSGYSMNRKHPIFKTHKPHQGVDYAAPSGTPVKAVGDGVIEKAGWGNGFGNMVVVRHSGGLQSMYSHLSGFASGAKKGNRVRQGQVIGYVGATGYATGPHLDFRLKQNGKYINPSKVVAPRGGAVPRGRMTAFAHQRNLVREYLKGERDIADYRR